MISIKNGKLNHLVDSQDRAFLYGDGFFTTVKIMHGEPCLWQRHIDRLIDCAEKLAFDVDIEEVEQQVFSFLAEHADLSGAIKIIISRGVGERGYMPPEQKADVHLQVFPRHLPALPDDVKPFGSTQGTVKSPRKTPIHSGLMQLTLGHTMPALVGLKTLNRLEQVLLRHELASTPWGEGLVADMQGNLVEGVSSNCFFYINNKWFTPILDQAGIVGVMRAEILDKMLENDIAHSIVNVPKAAIDQIEAMFYCNALTGIVPVKSLANRKLSLEPVQRIIDQFGL